MFDNATECEQFVEKINHIAETELGKRSQLFVLNSLVHRGQAKFNTRPKQIEWLEEDRQKILNRISVCMQQNHQKLTNIAGNIKYAKVSQTELVWEKLAGTD